MNPIRTFKYIYSATISILPDIIVYFQFYSAITKIIFINAMFTVNTCFTVFPHFTNLSFYAFLLCPELNFLIPQVPSLETFTEDQLSQPVWNVFIL